MENAIDTERKQLKNILKDNSIIILCSNYNDIQEINDIIKEKNITIYNIKEQDIEPKIEQIIDRYLLKLSASPKLKGFNYIKEAIYISIKDNKNKIKMKKGTYSYISKKYGTSNSAVESAIRRTIEKAIENVPYDQKEEIFYSTLYSIDEEIIDCWQVNGYEGFDENGKPIYN